MDLARYGNFAMYLRLGLIAVLFFATGLQSVCSGQNGECGSFFSALQANALSIERFDVCTESEALKVDNRNFRQTERLILDMPRQRALLLRNRVVKELGTDKQEASLEAYLTLADTTWRRSIHGDLRRASIPFEKALKVSGFTNVQLIGAMPFPTVIGSQSSGGDDDFEFLIRNANAYGKLEQNSRTAKVIATLPPRKPGRSNRFQYTFDLKTLVPKSAEWGWVDFQDGTELPFQPAHREQFRWRDSGGIMLPTSISRAREVLRSVGGKRVPENEIQETKLHWNSVNKPLPDDWWLPERWADLDEIRKQCVFPKGNK
ncbi:MAG: hypothetical protein Aurels2KO_15530 [Aureliella sp.]